MKGKHGASATGRRAWDALIARAEKAERDAGRLAADLAETREEAARQVQVFAEERRQLVAGRTAAEGPRVVTLNAEIERLRARVEQMEEDAEFFKRRHRKVLQVMRDLYLRLGMTRNEVLDEMAAAMIEDGQEVILTDGKARDQEAEVRIGMARGRRTHASLERLERIRKGVAEPAAGATP